MNAAPAIPDELRAAWDEDDEADVEHVRVAFAKPMIQVGPDLDRVVATASDVLTTHENTYARGGVLVRVVAETTTGTLERAELTPIIRTHTGATLALALAECAVWERKNTKGTGPEWFACMPPDRVARVLLDLGAWRGLRNLDRVASSPILRADGTIAIAQGYDAASATLIAYAGRVVVADTPELPDALRARDRLLDVVRDFPWTSDADRAAWLALVLTLVARGAIDGPVPMWTVTANVRGAGKSRLVDVASIIATGRVAARATQPTDDAEAGKVITSIVMSGDEAVLFDNIDRPLGGAKLDAFLTGSRWKDRVLGTNVTIDLPIRTVVAATGNNLELRGDTLRRVLPVRLDSPLERPEDRDDFAVSDLLGHVRARRLELVADALTILRGWYVAGCACSSSVKRWGSYEAWSGLIPHVLAWVGLPDPQLTREGLEQDDPQLRSLAAILEHWPALETSCAAAHGISVSRALTALYVDGRARHDDFDELREALEILAPGKNGKPVDARTLAHAFRRSRNRVLGGVRLVDLSKEGKVLRWGVRS
jgi:hypothetical protein